MFFFSCEKKNERATVDIINVVRDNATIPAYIYGNVSSEVFIILLHGGPGGSGIGYRGGQYSEMLESEFAVVYTDQRGQGMSQGNFKGETLTPEHLSGDVYALALTIQEKYDTDNIFLMGHSWGGLLGSQVMTDPLYSQIFRGWIEVDGAHDMPFTFKSGVRKIDSIATEQIDNGRSIGFWDGAMNTISNFDTVNITIEEFSELNALCYEAEQQLITDGVVWEPDIEFALDALGGTIFVNNGVTTFVSSLVSNSTIINNGLIDYSLTDKLKDIDKPSLLLWGKYDMVVPLELGIDAFNKIGVDESDKKLVIFGSSAHSPMVTEPLRFSSEVIEFVDKYKI